MSKVASSSASNPPEKFRNIPVVLLRKTIAYMCKHRAARLSDKKPVSRLPVDGPDTIGSQIVLLSATGKAVRKLPDRLIVELAASGLIEKDEIGLWRASQAAFSRMARERSGENSYLHQHLDLATAPAIHLNPGMSDTGLASHSPVDGGQRKKSRQTGEPVSGL